MKRYLSLTALILSLLVFSGCSGQPEQGVTKKDTASGANDTARTKDVLQEDGSQEGSSNRSGRSEHETETPALSSDEAVANALAHAGLAESQVTVTKNKLDYEDGRRVYEIEFYTEDLVEYDYEADASSGEILSYEMDAGNYAASDKIGNGSPLTEEDAKNLALDKVPEASEKDVREFKTELEDGRTEYEGKIICNGKEYEFEIDAASGTLLSWKEEPAD